MKFPLLMFFRVMLLNKNIGRCALEIHNIIHKLTLDMRRKFFSTHFARLVSSSAYRVIESRNAFFD